MAITSAGSFGTGVSGTSGTTLAVTPTGTIAVGTVLLLAIASDNIQSIDGNNSDVTSIADTGSNVWKKCREHTNSNGAAAGGTTSSLWRCKVTTQLTTGSTITITFRSAIVDKAASLWGFNVVTNLRIIDRVKNDTDASNGFGSLATSTVSSAEHLYFRALAKEANTATGITVTTNFTALTANRSRNNAAAQYVCGEFRINTSTAETSNPTLAVSGDTASVFVTFEDAADVAPATPQLIQSTSLGSTQSAGVDNFKVKLTYNSLSGNTLIGYANNGGSTDPTSVTDNQSNTWVKVGSKTDASQNLSVWICSNAAAGTREVTLNLSGTPTYVSFAVDEWYGFPAVDPVEGFFGNSGSGTALTTGSFTTGVDGSMVFGFSLQDSASTLITSWTAGSGFGLHIADILDSICVETQLQSTAGAINPATTMAPTHAWISCGFALRPAAQGTVRPSTNCYVLRTHHYTFDTTTGNSGSLASPRTFQFPTEGNLMITMSNFPNESITAMSDSGSNTWTVGAVAQDVVDGNSGKSQICYASNAVPSLAKTLTVTWSATDGFGNIICLDVLNAGAFDKTTNAHGQSASAADVTGNTITPAQANGLVVTVLGIDASVITGMTGGMNLVTAVTTPNIATSPIDNNNGFAIFNNTSTSAITNTWQHTAALHSWAEVSVAFSGPAAAGLGIVYAPPPMHMLVR